MTRKGIESYNRRLEIVTRSVRGEGPVAIGRAVGVSYQSG